MVDAAGRLVKDADHRNAETACRDRRTRERTRDRVEEHGARPEAARASKHRLATESSERERPLGEGEEDDARAVRRGCLGHALVVQVAPAQAARIA
jgi:hypothetical protein